MIVEAFYKNVQFKFKHEGKIIFYGEFDNSHSLLPKPDFLLDEDHKLIYTIKITPIPLFQKFHFISDTERIKIVFNRRKFRWMYHFYRGNDLYEIIPHKKLKTSFYKNGKQFGYFEYNRIEKFAEKHIRIVCDDDYDLLKIICAFIIAWMDYGVLPTPGNLGVFEIGQPFEAKKFDESWSPNLF